jgi:alkaline phosphatase D
MKKVHNLEVGPILGHTTDTTARFFGRLNEEKLHDELIEQQKKSCGVIRYREEQNATTHTYHFRFNESFDQTGIIELLELTAGTTYEYQMGFTSVEDVPDDKLDWEQLGEWYRFTTQAVNPTKISFMMGSCMYPNLIEVRGRNNRLTKLDRRVDKAFKKITDFSVVQDPVDFTLLLGDQVYADPSWVQFGASLDFYNNLYRETFSLPNFRKATAQTPTYMTLDDHEVENDFPSGIGKLDTWRDKAINALQAYTIYQASHSPVFDRIKEEPNLPIAYVKGQGLLGEVAKLYYKFEWGDTGVFMMDTRTERNYSDSRIISPKQMLEVQEWLLEKPRRAHFIGSAVPVFPDANKPTLTGSKKDKDKWSMAVAQRKELIDFIFTNKINNVFFLSGDVHASFGCTLTRDDSDIEIHNLVCSGLYWPLFPIINDIRWKRHNVLFGKSLENETGIISEPLADSYYEGNGISRIDVEGQSVKFRVFNRADLNQVTIDLTIDLKPWS